MRIRNLTVSNSRLTEGRHYPFRIVKSVNFGQDAFFVMQDPLGYKVLMPRHFYTHYGFEDGQTIECRVDKINCNGRMFLEPVHPFYKEGEEYPFPIVDYGIRINILDEHETFVKVEDIFKQQWEVRLYKSADSIHESNTLNCILERIKKGRLFLTAANDTPRDGGLKIGETYNFIIVDERINRADNTACFVLKDKNGKKHILRKKYYAHYGLKKGMEIKCRVDKFTSEGFFFLEPENPWYKTGEIYEFKIREINKLHFSDGSIQDVLVVEDPYGEDVKIFIDSKKLEKLSGEEKVKCRLNRVRKSRLELEII